MRRKIAAGNWKMNGLASALAEIEALKSAHPSPGCEIVVCPPATLLTAMSALVKNSAIITGGQDCHWAESGAHTGNLSAEMLTNAGAGSAIVGHSERRADHAETDEIVRRKAEAAHRAGLQAIVCVGETEAERDAGHALDVVGKQLRGSVPDAATAENTVIAYEPVWAIGTERTPTLGEISEVHDFMRENLVSRFGEKTGEGFRLLYGGSVKPGNAAEIFAVSNVDGGLVGGASLKAADFGAIIEAAGART